MFAITRPINGIPLNDKEYVRTDENDVMTFNSFEQAIEFLHQNGFTSEQVESEGIEVVPYSSNEVLN